MERQRGEVRHSKGLVTRRCRGHSEWELAQKKRPAECEHEQRTGEAGSMRGRKRKWWLTLGTDRKSAELSVNEPQSRGGRRKLVERGAKTAAETTVGWEDVGEGESIGRAGMHVELHRPEA